MSTLACSSSSSSRAQIETVAPSLASSSAMAFPIPLLAAVTMATLPPKPRSISPLSSPEIPQYHLTNHSRRLIIVGIPLTTSQLDYIVVIDYTRSTMRSVVSSKRKVSNPLALAVMALLYERPMHPYEMVSTLRERAKHEAIKLRYSSLYSVVEALEREALISPRETIREGRRPERTIYGLTEAGRIEFLDW